jgi:hypothetical protein
MIEPQRLNIGSIVHVFNKKAARREQAIIVSLDIYNPTKKAVILKCHNEEVIELDRFEDLFPIFLTESHLKSAKFKRTTGTNDQGEKEIWWAARLNQYFLIREFHPHRFSLFLNGMYIDITFLHELQSQHLFLTRNYLFS